MKSKLYQYAIVWYPTSKQEAEGMSPMILVEPKYILSRDRESALVAAAMDIPREYREELDQVDILIGVFGGQSTVKYVDMNSSNSTYYGNEYVNTLTNIFKKNGRNDYE
jgi:hypothetical protein